MTHDVAAQGRPLGQMRLRTIENILSGEGGHKGNVLRNALRYNRRNVAGYPCAIQVGGLCDPCDEIERQQGWLRGLLELAIRYRQPLRLSTKGTVLQESDYLRIIDRAPELFWVAFSIITCDDALLTRIDRGAPSASARLATMRVLSEHGVKTSLRFRPILPRVSDSTVREPWAYRTLIDKSAEAGAQAVSYEVAFAPGAITRRQREKWAKLCAVTGIDLIGLYRHFGPTTSCMRPSYGWTENIMHAIREEAHACGLVVGVSDPVWKQLTDTGCCCGILPDDPVFGNWQVESATNQLLLAKVAGKRLHIEDVTPAWAHLVPKQWMVASPAGPTGRWRGRHTTWADVLRLLWNDMERIRGPLHYFQGALMPDGRDANGNVVYEHRGLERQRLAHVPFWSEKMSESVQEDRDAGLGPTAR